MTNKEKWNNEENNVNVKLTDDEVSKAAGGLPGGEKLYGYCNNSECRKYHIKQVILSIPICPACNGPLSSIPFEPGT